VGSRLCLQVRLDDHDHIQRVGKLLVQQLGLIHTGFDPVFHTRLTQEALGNGVDIELVTLLAAGTSPLVGTIIRNIQGRVRAQLHN
jgi:hypothetical protein